MIFISLSLILLAVLHSVSGGVRVKAPVGGNATIRCQYEKGSESYPKYFKKGRPQGKEEIVISSGSTKQSHDARLYLEDDRNKKEFTVTIRNVSAEDAGQYWCGVDNWGTDTLTEVNLDVVQKDIRVHQSSPTSNTENGPPENTVVSLSPSGEIEEGSSVTLTCISDANPPVDSYTWFKMRTTIGKGETYRISEISSEDSGEYKCKASNAEGFQYSTGVTLNVIVRKSKMVIVYVTTGVTMCVLAILSSIVYWKSSQKRRTDEHEYQNAQDDTYTPLSHTTRSPDDVYQTMLNPHSSPSNDTYMALDPYSMCAEYNTLAL